MAKTTVPKLVTVFGGSGFVGRHVVRALAKRGYRVRVAVRRPDLAGHLQPMGDVGQIQFEQANLRYRWSINRACEGADIIVNLVGILAEGGKQKFDSIQTFGAKSIAEAASQTNASLVHVSSLGCSEESKSRYAQSKAKGEEAVRQAATEAIILRSSIIFGPEDNFFNKFATMAQFSPVLPAIGGGHTRFQPVYVDDVAEAVALAVDGKAEANAIYELGGPEVVTFRECLEIMLETINRKRWIVSLPWWLARFYGRILGLLPRPVLTLDQVYLLKTDNVVSGDAEAESLTLQGLGIQPTAMKAVLPSYLVRFKAHGQYGDQTIA